MKIKSLVKFNINFAAAAAVLVAVMALSGAARADEITDWNRIAQQALLNAVPPISPIVSTRSLAIVQVSVFDAVNGIERHYVPIHADMDARPGASRRAAAVQAAYVSLSLLMPAQQAFFNAQRTASLNAIASGNAAENSQSIARGIEFGQAVANNIFFWRSTDGIADILPPFLGGMDPGQWRSTVSGAGLQFADMTPWAMNTPGQFHPAGPPTLTSPQYTADYNEVAAIGSIGSLTRTADQTQIAIFWNGNTPVMWNRAARFASEQRHLTFSANARLFAVMNVAMADAVIACWEAKYYYVFWRPITAIRLGSTDGNPGTTEDTGWTPLLTTPNHPDYPSGHATVSPAAAKVLRSYFDDDTNLTLTSETTGSVERQYSSFTQAVQEAFDARIYGGIHFRTACQDGRATGDQVGDLVVATVAQSRHGH